MQNGKSLSEILPRRKSRSIQSFNGKFFAITIEKSHEYIVPCAPLDFSAMALYIVRHGKAGKRSQWDGPDMTRPLDDLGRIQAKEISLTIAAIAPTWLVSSPFLRCMQTLQDLSELTGLPVLVDERLAEDSDIVELQIRRSNGDTLSPSEANQLGFFTTLALRVTESQYVLHESGLLNADERRALRYRLAGPARFGGYLEIIAQCPDCYTPQFRAWMESIVEDPAREP